MKVFKFSTETPSILQPILQNHWRLLFNSSRIIKKDIDILTAQTTRCKIDYLKREIIVQIEQSIVGDEHKQIFDLCTDETDHSLRIDVLNAGNTIHHSLDFFGCQIVAHELILDYALGDILRHTLTIKFKNVQVLVPNYTKDQKST